MREWEGARVCLDRVLVCDGDGDAVLCVLMSSE